MNQRYGSVIDHLLCRTEILDSILGPAGSRVEEVGETERRKFIKV